MDGLFWEHGPLLTSEHGNRLIRNPWAWSKLANMLYLEAPVGVGYSYSDDVSDYNTLDDQVTAQDNLQALKVFFSKFPEYKQRAFYVTGESYGGVYVPTLSYAIFQDSTVDWNMTGFAVGNGVMDWTLMAESSVPFLYGHGAISGPFMQQIEKTCQGQYANPSDACQTLLNVVTQNTAGLNMYDFYRDCFAHQGIQSRRGPVLGWELAKNPSLFKEVVKAPRPAHAALGENVPCIDSVGGTEWLSTPAVRSALHIKDGLPAWTICSDAIHYTTNQNYSAPRLYDQMAGKYRILIYNGDTDMACDYVADSTAMNQVQAPVDPNEAWVPWLLDAEGGAQTVGFITSYQTEPGMHFLTVKGAGHMVPQWKPQVAYAMMDRFLNRKDIRTGAQTRSQQEIVV